MIDFLLTSIKSWVFPTFCLGCKQAFTYKNQLICPICQNALPSTGNYVSNNLTEQTLWGRFKFEAAFSIFYFTQGSVIQSIMHELKYNKNKKAGLLLGDFLADYLKKNILYTENSLLVPVPLTAKKKYQRGYNQSALICEQAGKVLGIAVADDALLRIKETETQTKKTRLQRVLNMELAFDTQWATLHKGKHIILVDDTLTTGATVEACALQLLKIPNSTLSIATIAIVQQ